MFGPKEGYAPSGCNCNVRISLTSIHRSYTHLTFYGSRPVCYLWRPYYPCLNFPLGLDLSLVGSVPLLNINRFRRGQAKRLVDFCALARGWKASLTVSWREVKVSIVAQIAEQFSQFGRQMHSQNPFLLPSFRTNHPSNYSTSTSKTSRHHSMISGHRLLASSRIVSGKDILDAVRQESRF